MIKEKRTFQPLTSEDICKIYELLHKEELVLYSLSIDTRKNIGAIVANVNAEYFGQSIYQTPQEKAFAYFYFIIKDHAFVDGNKRMACLLFAILCDINQLTIRTTDFTLDELAVYIESLHPEDHQQLIRELAEQVLEA